MELAIHIIGYIAGGVLLLAGLGLLAAVWERISAGLLGNF